MKVDTLTVYMVVMDGSSVLCVCVCVCMCSVGQGSHKKRTCRKNAAVHRMFHISKLWQHIFVSQPICE